MVQEFQVIRCFSCQIFQVHQVKKSKQWSCKLCGAKQSLLKVYGQGTGADCRHHVQKLNLLQGEVQQGNENDTRLETEEDNSEVEQGEDQEITLEEGPSVSRWNKYIKVSPEEMVAKDEQEDEWNGLIYTDKQQLYSQQKRDASENRKRRKMLHGDEDSYNKDYEIISKRPAKCSANDIKREKTCKDWKASENERKYFLQEEMFCKPDVTESSKFSSEHMTVVSTKATCLESKWGKFLSFSTSEENTEDISSFSGSHLKGYSLELANSQSKHGQETNELEQEYLGAINEELHSVCPVSVTAETTLNKGADTTSNQKEMPVDCKIHPDNKYMVPHETGLHLADYSNCDILVSSVAKTSSKLSSHSSLFQTDEDFDDDY